MVNFVSNENAGPYICRVVIVSLLWWVDISPQGRRPEFPSGRIFWGSSAFFLWIGAYAGLTAPQSDVGGRVRMSLLIIEESSEAGHA